MKIGLSKKITEYAKKILIVILIMQICIISIGNLPVRAEGPLRIIDRINSIDTGVKPDETDRKKNMEIINQFFNEMYESSGENKDRYDKAAAYLLNVFDRTNSGEVTYIEVYPDSLDFWVNVALHTADRKRRI